MRLLADGERSLASGTRRQQAAIWELVRAFGEGALRANRIRAREAALGLDKTNESDAWVERRQISDDYPHPVLVLAITPQAGSAAARRIFYMPTSNSSPLTRNCQ